MLEPSQAERILLSSIQTPTPLYTLLQKYGITSESFFYFQEPAKFIFDYITDQGSAPTPTLISSTFANTSTPFDPSPIDNFDYIAQQYATINVRQKAFMAIATSQKWLQESPNDGVMLLAKQLERIAKPDTTHRSSLERTTESRWQSYLA